MPIILTEEKEKEKGKELAGRRRRRMVGRPVHVCTNAHIHADLWG